MLCAQLRLPAALSTLQLCFLPVSLQCQLEAPCKTDFELGELGELIIKLRNECRGLGHLLEWCDYISMELVKPPGLRLPL